MLNKIHFWDGNYYCGFAAITLPLGITAGKEYAELEWPIDIAIALICRWCLDGICLAFILKRRGKHLYVAIWFYIATWVTVAGNAYSKFI